MSIFIYLFHVELGQILCTQPRKLAACSLATRVAEEYGCKLGEEVVTKLKSEFKEI